MGQSFLYHINELNCGKFTESSTMADNIQPLHNQTHANTKIKNGINIPICLAKKMKGCSKCSEKLKLSSPVRCMP